MFFENITDLKSLRDTYKKLVFLYHPDLNPQKSDAEMKAINQEYEILLERLRIEDKYYQGFSEQKKEEEFSFDQELREKLDSLLWLKDLIEIDLEICGTWIWLSGETKKYKEKIKENGFFWASDKKKWYWKPKNQKRKNFKSWSMDQIRSVYGSYHFEQTSEKQKEKDPILNFLN